MCSDFANMGLMVKYYSKTGLNIFKKRTHKINLNMI